MPSIEERVAIRAPAERVFDRLADPERAPEWTPNLLRVQRTSEIQAGRGVETALVARVGNRESQGTGRCTEWERPRRLVLESSLDVGITTTTTFDLAEQEAGTLVLARVDYTLPPKGLGRLVGGLLGETMARRDMRKGLQTLKAQLEG